MRAGSFEPQTSGYEAFIPRPLPPERLDVEGLANALAEAERALGRLDGATDSVPNADWFVAMFVRQEAVLSSQIEGTQSSLEQILRYEADQASTPATQIPDVEETISYVRAMNVGLERVKPGSALDLPLIRDLHQVLMQGVRGSDKSPGQFRTEQNWIGAHGAPITRATFIPPPPEAMRQALVDLERYLPDQRLPTLIVAGLAHAQFETIYPFRDGNGRIGRLLITLMLCQRAVLQKPLLYLSLYFKRHRSDYYALLQGIRIHGDWEAWLHFFLKGVREVAGEALQLARRIHALREQHRALASRWRTGYGMIEALYAHPYMTARLAEQLLDVDFKTANSLLRRFANAGIVIEVTGRKRDRIFKYAPYIELFTSA